jgi:uncharacterized membrane protein YeaQ/YmgE (transglycosylase-associated protein family)
LDVASLVVGLLIAFLLIGAAAGLLAGLLMPGGGLGLRGKIGSGIAGAGGLLFGFAPLSIEEGLGGAPVAATLGAALLLFIARRIKHGGA